MNFEGMQTLRLKQDEMFDSFEIASNMTPSLKSQPRFLSKLGIIFFSNQNNVVTMNQAIDFVVSSLIIRLYSSFCPFKHWLTDLCVCPELAFVSINHDITHSVEIYTGTNF